MEAALRTTPALTPIEARIVRDARRFDLRPLLDVLSSIGYGEDDILFESNPEGRSQTIIAGVRFQKRPFKVAIITVQTGLLGDNSLLPSYFLHVAERSPDAERFYDFLRFFDHLLIDNLYRALHPDHGPGRASWNTIVRSMFRMAMPASPSTLHWVAQLYFPELSVRVTRRPFANRTDIHACRTGVSRLDGTGVLGRTYTAEVAGYRVDLFADDEVDMSGRQWADVVLLRLQERFLPLLAPFRIPLVIRLVVRYHASFAHVDDPAAKEKGYLGYDRLRDKGEAVHTTLMYRGITGEATAPIKRGG